MIIGEERAVDELWGEARARMPKPRDDRPGQPVYVLEDAPEPGDSGLRAATARDLELLVPACAEAHREEIGIDPLRRDPEGSIFARLGSAGRRGGRRASSSASKQNHCAADETDRRAREIPSIRLSSFDGP